MNTSKFLSLFGSLFLMAACGSQVARQSGVLGGGSASSGTTEFGVQLSAGNIYGLPLAQEFTANLNGASGAVPSASYTISTSRTLRVKVTPLPAPNLSLNGFNNWVFPYGCVSLKVSANGTQQTTQVLRVSGTNQTPDSPCANAPTSQILDFSNAVTGFTGVNVTVSNPNYDNCRYTWPLQYNCGMSPTFQTHVVSATIAVQGDGYWLNP